MVKRTFWGFLGRLDPSCFCWTCQWDHQTWPCIGSSLWDYEMDPEPRILKKLTKDEKSIGQIILLIPKSGLILVRLSRLFHATTCAVFWVLMFSNWVFAFSNWVFEVFFKILIRFFCNLMKTQTLFLRISPYFGEFQLNFAILDHLGSWLE